MNGTGAVAVAAADGQPSDGEQSSKKLAKWRGLGVRVLAGATLLGAGTGCLVQGGLAYGVWVAAISYFCTVEYFGFITSNVLPKGVKAPPTKLREALVATCVGLNLAASIGVRGGLFETSSFALLAMLLVHQSGRKKRAGKGNRRLRITQLTSLIFGLFYCGYLPSFWIRLRTLEATLPAGSAAGLVTDVMGNTHSLGLVATLISILGIVAADSLAYLGGKAFGRNPLTSLSPSKTWEGAACGLAGCVAAAAGLCWFFQSPFSSWPWVVGLAAVVFTSSLFGDLIESSMKREAGVKDSGNIIPGHGGILDRFDSYVFTGALTYFYWYWSLWAQGVQLSRLFVGF